MVSLGFFTLAHFGIRKRISWGARGVRSLITAPLKCISWIDTLEALQWQAHKSVGLLVSETRHNMSGTSPSNSMGATREARNAP